MDEHDLYRGFSIYADQTFEGFDVYVVLIKGHYEHALDCASIEDARQLVDDIITAAQASLNMKEAPYGYRRH